MQHIPQVRIEERILEHCSDAILAVDAKGGVSYLNPASQRLLGYTAEDYRSSTFHDLLHRGRCAGDPLSCQLLRLPGTRGSVVDHGEFVFDKSGTCHDVSMSATPLESDGELMGHVVSFRTISHPKQFPDAGLEGEMRLKQLVEADVVGIVFGDRESLHEANDYFLRLIGYSREELGAGLVTWERITAPEYGASCRRLLDVIHDTGVCPTSEKEYIAKDGTRIPVMIGGVRTNPAPDFRLMGFVIDQTERKALEQRLQQAEKLEGIAVLAGGIAHDFNNLLTVISGYANRLLSRFPQGVPPHDQVREISNAAVKAVELTRQLLAFGRRQTGDPAIVHAPDFLREIQDSLTRLAAPGVELLFSFAPDTGCIRVDAAQFDVVLRNLITNACDAMPQGGKVFIETSRMVVATPFAAMCLGAPEGTYVMVAVSDTGLGMGPDVQARIFEPFFTTKAQGKGTGLGLSTVYGIVKQSGGHIRVHSTQGLGTAFRVLFPAVDTTGAMDIAISGDDLVGGTETILLVDDEHGLRKFVRELLEGQGYTTLDAGNGQDAILLAEHYRGKIDLLLTDIVLPEMSGVEIIQRVRAIRPGIPVLRMSGYTDRFGVDMDANTPYIQKPFSEPKLLRRIREVLDAAARPATL